MSSIPDLQNFLTDHGWGTEVARQLARHGVTTTYDAADKSISDYKSMGVPMRYAQILARQFSCDYTEVSKKLRRTGYSTAICKKLFKERYLTFDDAKELDTELLRSINIVGNEARRILRLFMGDEEFMTYISHSDEVVHGAAEKIYEQLEKEFEGKRIYFDTEDLTDLSEIQQDVRRSQTMLVLISNSYFISPYCILELVEAHENNIPICACVVDRAFNSNVFREVKGRWDILERAGKFTGVEFLRQQGITFDKYESAMSYLENRRRQIFDVDRDAKEQMPKIINSLKDCLAESANRPARTVSEEGKGGD